MTPAGGAWLVLVLTSVALFGNYYVYDSIGPVAALLSAQLGFSDIQIGTLNAIYSLPNIVLVFIGGLATDRYGAARVTFWTAAVCLAGALLTAWGEQFAVMAAGRLLFGIGAETMIVATLAALSQWFGGRHLAFAMALSISVARLGSYAADVSPVWAAGLYSHWQPPLMLAAGTAALSLAGAALYLLVDRRAPVRAGVTDAPATGVAATPAARIRLRDMLRFGGAYWWLVALGVTFYAVIFPFRSTFAIKYFQDAHGLSLAAAGTLNGYVFLAAAFATPLFGWLADRIGRHALLLSAGAALLLLAFVVLVVTPWPPGVATVLIGVSFSLVPAVIWPATALLVSPGRLGAAFGFMTMAQNVGLVVANVVAGALNDAAGAGPTNPAGYAPMIVFFALLSLAALACALRLAVLRPRAGEAAAAVIARP